MMRAYRKCGVSVVIISGTSTSTVTQADVGQKQTLIENLGLSKSYDKLVVVQGPEPKIAARKARYLSQQGCDILIDNSTDNARACRAVGILCLVPWQTRSLY
jgi:hypothetical protein